MKKDLMYQERIDENLRLSKSDSIRSIVGVMDYLVGELETNMNAEKRFRGIVLSYFNSIRSSYSEIYSEYKDSDSKNESKMLFLLKPALHKELWRLNRKGLSRADSIIVLLHKIFGIVTKIDSSKEYISIGNLIQKLYDNIRTKSKSDSIFTFSNFIQNIISYGYVGKYELELFTAFPDKKEGGESVQCRVQKEENNSWEKEF